MSLRSIHVELAEEGLGSRGGHLEYPQANRQNCHDEEIFLNPQAGRRTWQEMRRKAIEECFSPQRRRGRQGAQRKNSKGKILSRGRGYPSRCSAGL